MMKHCGKWLAAAMLAAALCLGTAPVYALAAPAMTQSTLESKQADASSPLGTLQLALEAVKALDVESFNRYTDNIRADGNSAALFNSNIREPQGMEKEMAQELFRLLSWTVESVTEDGDTAWIALKVTNADLTAVVGTLIQESIGTSLNGSFDEAQAGNRMKTLIQDAQKKATITLDVTVKAVKTAGSWKIHLDEALVNAVCGNLVKGISEPTEIDAIAQAFAALAMDSQNDWAAFARRAAQDALSGEALQKKIADCKENFKKQLEQALREALE